MLFTVLTKNICKILVFKRANKMKIKPIDLDEEEMG
jgi:hypothetical protein